MQLVKFFKSESTGKNLPQIKELVPLLSYSLGCFFNSLYIDCKVNCGRRVDKGKGKSSYSDVGRNIDADDHS